MYMNTDGSPPEVYAGTPFNSPLRDFGNHADQIKELTSRPDLIIRAVPIRKDKMDEWKKLFLESEERFEELNSNYNIKVPSRKFVIGEVINPSFTNKKDNYATFFTVTDKIIGSNLDDISYKPEERDMAKRKLDTFYSNLTRYFSDKYKNGGLFARDIARNEQYVYGRKKGDTEDHVYLVDIDPGFLPFNHPAFPNPEETYLEYLRKVLFMISQSEQKLDGRLTESREKLKTTINELPEGATKENVLHLLVQDALELE